MRHAQPGKAEKTRLCRPPVLSGGPAAERYREGAGGLPPADQPDALRGPGAGRGGDHHPRAGRPEGEPDGTAAVLPRHSKRRSGGGREGRGRDQPRPLPGGGGAATADRDPAAGRGLGLSHRAARHLAGGESPAGQRHHGHLPPGGERQYPRPELPVQ